MLAIFDIFADEEARDAHFSGAVAAALKQNADALVDGGVKRSEDLTPLAN
jgi:quinol monooxygenase YgiN